MKRELGLWGLTALGITGVVGSGWLFAALYAAKLAGPAATVAWVIGGFLMLLTGLCFAEVATAYPLSGGGAQLAAGTHGRTVGMVSLWLLYLGYVTTPAIEAAAIVDYTGSFFPALVATEGAVLSWPGRAVAVVVSWVFVVLSFFGIRWLARLNNTLTWWKFAIPLAVVIVLFALHFNASNFGLSDPPVPAAGTVPPPATATGFMPMGWTGVLAALSTGGIVFSLSGFRIVADMAEEAANPGRDIPRAFGIAILFATSLYVLIQMAFIGALDPASYANGWDNLSFEGDNAPFVSLLRTIGVGWLASVLFVDAVVSPGGSCLAYTAGTGRVGYAVASAGFAPRIFAEVNGRGVPVASLLACAAINTVVLFCYPAWDQLAALNSAAYFLSVAPVAAVLLTLRRIDPDTRRPFRLPCAGVIAWAAFVTNALIVSWCGPWSVLPTAGVALLVLAVGSVRAWRRRAVDPSAPSPWGAMWMGVLLVGVSATALCSEESLGGYGWIPEPWNSVLTAAVASAALWCAGRASAWGHCEREALDEVRQRSLASLGAATSRARNDDVL